jgi:A/G-specific adenine glycosylase
LSNIFSKKIIDWYLLEGRSGLPWRKDITPYRVWISEVMLQQTQVKTVIPYFNRFIAKYPDIKSISKASEGDILALWTGLGFYRRAQNIFKAKEIISNNFCDEFPKKFEEINSPSRSWKIYSWCNYGNCIQ